MGMASPSRESLEAHARFLSGLARALLRNRDDAEELVQDTFRAALEDDRRRGDLRGWLVGTARNLARLRARSRARRERRERQAPRPPDPPSPARAAERADVARIVAEAVAALPDPGRRIVRLRFDEEQSAAEIARAMGVTPKTVRLHLRRSLARLREDLERRLGRRTLLALLLALAGARRTAAGVLAAAALVAVGLAALVFAAARRDDAPPRHRVAEVAPAPGRAPPQPPLIAPPAAPAAPPPVPDEARPPAPPPAPAPAPPEAEAEAEREPRPDPPAPRRVHNDPQEPLPKHGLGVDWGQQAIFFSRTGRHRLVAFRRDLSFEYELWEGGPGEVPESGEARLRAESDRAFAELLERARAGRLVGRGVVHQLPERVSVLEREAGAVLFERDLHHGYGNSLSFLDAEGRLRWTLTLEELLGEGARDRYEEFDVSVLWNRSLRVDEERRVAVVETVDRRVFEVAFDDGAVREREVVPPPPRAVDARELEAALAGTPAEVEAKLGAGALGSIAAYARDEARPFALRLRALRAHRFLAPRTPAGAVVGDLPALLAAGLSLVESDRDLEIFCEKELVLVGDPAADPLLRVIEDGEAHIQARRQAAEVLSKLGSMQALDHLLRAAAQRDNIIVFHAAAGLAALPKAKRDPALCLRLLAGSPADVVLAEHFRAYPCADAVEPLLRALERHLRAGDGSKAEVFGGAIQACSGHWIEARGDPAAWRRALGLK
jgi:RNA polymerase sigma-70 factor (ECF subfamily)